MSDVHPNVPAHLRAELERFAKGCDACGAMNWRVKRAEVEAIIYECSSCGQPLHIPAPPRVA